MAIESDDEARRAAERIIADVASGDTEAGDVFTALYTDADGLRVGRHLAPLLHEALQRWNDGDRSLGTERLVALVSMYRRYQEDRDAKEAVAAAERAAERRAATSAAIPPAPDIAHRMTGVWLYDVPVPDDLVPHGDFSITSVAEPEALMAFYIAHLRATGWTLDLDNSRPVTSGGYPPQCYFARSDLPGRYVTVLTAPGPAGTRLLITEDEE